jgi:hypothetical protein
MLREHISDIGRGCNIWGLLLSGIASARAEVSSVRVTTIADPEPVLRIAGIRT